MCACTTTLSSSDPVPYTSELQRPSKRAKLLDTVYDVKTPPARIDETEISVRHPLGVRPSGNALLAIHDQKSACGYLYPLPDEVISFVLDLLDAKDLLHVGATCRALHAFTRNDELWRALCVDSPSSHRTWRGTWRSTLLCRDPNLEPIIDCSNLFSDVLHRPFHCSHVSLEPFAANIPARNQIRRVADCSSDEVFAKEEPLILTSPVKSWPAFKEWSVTHLLQKYADISFRAEAVDWPLKEYVSYMRNNSDESPLYLFDSHFISKMSLSSAPPYTPPSCFGPSHDLFSVLGHQRPDHRWLILGPARSGSTFHKDPNGTCAWNAVLTGRKYWIMFPASPNLPPPPGVFVSSDQSEITAPTSIAEWLLTFHADARRAPGCKEGICHAGEVLYVPAGWYHLVLNLDESLALTQNFVPRHRLADVLLFLRDSAEQVSGFGKDVEDPYALFVQRLEECEPDLLREAKEIMEKRTKSKRAKWDELTDKTNETEGFSFGFEGSDDEVP